MKKSLNITFEAFFHDYYLLLLYSTKLIALLFNSIEFLLFLPVVFVLYWFVVNKSLTLQNSLLLIASYFFYGWWSFSFLGLLALSTALEYFYGFGVASSNRIKAKLFLTLSVINSLGILAIFKYYNFFASQLQAALASIGTTINPVFIQVALPVGISFYTFHGMSYVFDIYRGKQKPVRNPIDYAVFVSFFPLLVAGPIERAHHLLPQIQSKRKVNYNQLVEGCRLILWGFFKKVIIADTLGNIADLIFNNYSDYNSYTLLLGVLAFSFQIYGDFSGYSDIAIGLGKLFGIELLSNFKFPYFSRDIAEFWRRWHISLSSWFRDYVYIPLGGSHQGKFKSVRNIFIIFLLSGFWHGASWNFIVWGTIHAIAFLPLFLLNKNRKYSSSIVAENSKWPTARELYQMASTFLLVSFAWIYFRIVDINDANKYIISIFSNFNVSFADLFNEIKIFYEITIIIPLIVIEWRLRRDERKLVVPENKLLRWGIYILLISLILFNMSNKQDFIYFQF